MSDETRIAGPERREMSTDLGERLREMATWADGFHQTGLGAFLSPVLREAAEALPQWQPIETAPKDGERVLLWVVGAPKFGHFSQWEFTSIIECWAGTPQRFSGWVDEYSGLPFDPQPTHWMPLPAPPEGEQQK